MDSIASPPKFLFLFLISFIVFVCSTGSVISDVKQRELIQTTQHDFTNPPFNPTTPVTNPVTTPLPGATTPPETLPPPLITVPSANPATATPFPPAADPNNPNPNPAAPTTFPPATDPNNPNPAAPTTFPPATDPNNPPVPVTNPVTTPSTGTPAVAPPAVVNAPAVPGQSWCVARGGVPESVIQSALDYACGIGSADCAAIQQGANCYNPNSLQNHASYAFNSYYQKNPVQTSCDFGGAAMVTNVNPSSGSCVFTTSSSSSGSPATFPPATPTQMPTPSTGYGTSPTTMNGSNPAFGGGIGGGMGGFGEIPPTATTSSATSRKPFFGCIVVAASIIIGLRNINGV